MTTENFAYWLQGLLELNPDLKTLDEKQVKMIREHLGYVFNKSVVVPSNPPILAPHQPQGTSSSYPPFSWKSPFWTTKVTECTTSSDSKEFIGTQTTEC